MGFFSKVGSFVKKAAGAVVSGAKKVWEKTKEVAVNAVVWMAEKAERFVGQIKKVVENIKPFIQEKLRPFLKVAAVAVAVPFPWLSAAILKFDVVLGKIAEFSESKLVQKVERALQWVIDAAKQIKERLLQPQEIEEAYERREVLQEAKETLRGADRNLVEVAELINNFVIIRSVIDKALEDNNVKDFEHYLRLRAAQKLMAGAEQTIVSAKSFENITEDDVFLLKVGANLIASNPQLSDEDAIRLDELICIKFGKKLIPFVFEEMIVAWNQNLNVMEKDWKQKNQQLSKNEVLRRRISMAKKLSEISAEEERILTDLDVNVPAMKADLNALGKRTREMRNYVYAAEGFIQVLEKTAEELEAEDRSYLAEDGGRVGMIIIDCAQHGKPWEDLSEEEKDLIIDYANIFEEASQQRTSQLLQLEFAA